MHLLLDVIYLFIFKLCFLCCACHLDQIVQGVVVLVQAGLRALHSVFLVLRVWQTRCLDFRCAATQRASAPRTTQLLAWALWSAIGGGRSGGRSLSRVKMRIAHWL